MTDDDVAALCEKFVSLAKLDYVGFWEILVAIQKKLSDFPDQNERIIAISVINFLFLQGVRPFTFEEGSTQPVFWQYENFDEAIDQIISRWDALPERVGLGDVCWFGNQ